MAIITNREFFNMCNREQLAQINRYAHRILSKRWKNEGPIWEKEKVYNEFLDEPIDIRKFEAAKLNSRGEALPENFYYSHQL